MGLVIAVSGTRRRDGEDENHEGGSHTKTRQSRWERRCFWAGRNKTCHAPVHPGAKQNRQRAQVPVLAKHRPRPRILSPNA